MDYLSLSPIEQAALREAALRRAHELRRQAIADAWSALARWLRRPPKVVPRASPSLR
jgi:hypothetical protein